MFQGIWSVFASTAQMVPHELKQDSKTQ